MPNTTKIGLFFHRFYDRSGYANNTTHYWRWINSDTIIEAHISNNSTFSSNDENYIYTSRVDFICTSNEFERTFSEKLVLYQDIEVIDFNYIFITGGRMVQLRNFCVQQKVFRQNYISI